MKLLELGICLIVAYTIISLLLESSIIDFKLENDQQQQQGEWSALHFAGRKDALANSQLKATKRNETSREIRYIEDQLETPKFFPSYGTEAFFKQCSWTLQKRDDAAYTYNCTLLARPKPETTEGLSDIVSQLASGHMIAQQKNCRLLFDYGPDVDVSQFVTPFSPLNNMSLYAKYRPINWTVPSESELNSSAVFRTEQDYNNGVALLRLKRRLGHLAQIPTYRFAYSNAQHYVLNASHYDEIQQTLPGFTVETGMACSLGSLLRLSPSASQLEPNLFSTILPTLHQENTFVMALYIRTGRTDHLAGMKNAGKDPFPEDRVRLHYSAKRIVACAQRLEQERASDYSRIVWMVVTDSQYLKQWITKEYDTSNSTTTISKRQVVTTTSRGAHTRGKQSPSTADVAEAFIDWYLIGESHLVVSDTNSPSFGGTAALRTARPYYRVPMMGDPSECSLVPPVH